MATSFSVKRNNAYSTLLYSHVVSDGRITVQAADASLFPASFPFRITVYQSSGTGNLGQRYGTVFNVNSAASNVFAVTVASDESPTSTDQAFTVAAGKVFSVELDWTYGSAHEYETAINAAENNIATLQTETSSLLAGNLLAYVPLSSNFSTGSNTAVQVTGLTATVTVPSGGRSIRITAYGPSCYSDGAGDIISLSLWDGVVGSGTQLVESDWQNSNANQHSVMEARSIVTPAAGSKTYNVGLRDQSSGNAHMLSASGAYAFLLVELI